MDALQQFESDLAGLIAQSRPAAVRQLAGQLARKVRLANQSRIKAQTNPDGSAFAPRASNARKKRGKIRRAMFVKLRTAKWLKITTTSTDAIIKFVGRGNPIAKAHHYGATVQGIHLPARQLLGIMPAEVDEVKAMIIAHLARR